MSWHLAFLLLQSAAGSGNPAVTIAEPTEGLGRVHACLVAKTQAWLSEFDWKPEAEERWRWATAIVGQCDAGIVSVAQEGPLGGLAKVGQPNFFVGVGNVTPERLLRSEALYFVDHRLRDHFESQEAEPQ